MTKSLGQQLQQIRESREISLEEIAHKTHIRLDYLEALEAGDEEALPSNTQMRGFLRLYANELGVEISSLHVKAYQLSEEDPSKSDPAEDQETESANLESSEQDKPILDPETVLSSRPETPAIEQKALSSKAPEEPKTAPEEKSSASIFSSVGQSLQKRRELLSLSIEDVHENTHIRQRFISAMETGQFDLLPSAVQARGMLANYADFLNLDVDTLLLKYADGLQLQRLEKQSQVPQKAKQTAQELSSTRLQIKNFFSLDLVVIAVFFIAFAVFVIWGVNRILAVDSPGSQATELPEVVDILLATGSPTTQLTIIPNGTASDLETQSTQEETPTPLFTPLLNNNPINLVIIAQQRTWVQVTSDSELVFEGRLLPGNAYDYSGEESVEIRTGNAGALQIYFNEEDLGAPGLMGQVVSLIFTENGLILPTPSNSPTITETLEESLTPTITPSPSLTPSLSPTPSPTNLENDDETS